jgi:DNA-directed RNA polymerase specialized sigma24 family protein
MLLSAQEVLDNWQTRGLYEMAQEIALAHHCTVRELAGREKYEPLPAARTKFWEYLRGLGWSLHRIGDICGVDHTTVHYALSKGRRAAAKKAYAKKAATKRAAKKSVVQKKARPS